MAIRLKVEFSALNIQITKQEFASLQASSDATTLLEFVNLKTGLDFVNLNTVLTLDSDTKNLYFMASLGSPNAETISFTDTDVRNVGLGKSDITSVGDQDPTKIFNLGKSDTPTITEQLTKVVQFNRSLADATSMAEAIASKDTSIGKSDSSTVTEELAKLFSSAQADTTSVTEQAIRNVGIGKTDTVSFSDPIEVEVELVKADSLSFSDSPTLETGKANSDTLQVAETDTKLFGKNVEEGAGENQTFAVTVVSTGNGNKYVIDGVQQDTLSLKVGFTYTLDQSDSSNSGHPLRFSTTSNGTHAGGVAYTTDVSINGTPGSSGAYTRITVTNSTPSTLYYYCTNHSAMGGQANITTAGIPTTKTYEVTVATGTNVYGSGNKFYIDGLPSPGLILNEGFTYTFDQSDSSNSNHPLRFSITGNGTHNSGTEYTTNITTNGTPGSSGAYTRIEVTSSTPDLHYYCSNHSGMGAETSVQDDGDTTFDVTVATGVNNHGSGNKYYIDGVITPIVHLVAGNTYTFNQSDSSNSNHPFRFSETSNGSHASGTEYTTGVTTNGTPGSSGAFTRIQITNSTVTTLYYYCTNHSGMGGEVNSSIAEAGGLSLSESLSRIVAYIRTFTDAAALDDTASASDDLATESGIVKNNVLSVSDSPSLSTNKPNISDTYNVTESTELLVSLAKSETFGFSDAQTFNFSLAPSDSLSVSEVLSLGGQTIFADQLSVTETTNLNSADGVQDSTSIVENLVSEFGSALSDNISMSENSVHSFSKSLTDSATISESVSILFIPGGGSILNTAALNTFVLN